MYKDNSDASELILPLLYASVDSQGKYLDTLGFGGSGFFINPTGTLVTCKHNLDVKDPNVAVFAYHKPTNQTLFLSDIKRHPTYDFAVAETGFKVSRLLSPYIGEIAPGLDVRAVGYNHSRGKGKDTELILRTFKGNIVGIRKNIEILPAKKICELSFPSLTGFSGAPVVTDNSQQESTRIIGMLYGNSQSGITVFSEETEHDSNGTKTIVTQERIVEFGVCHLIDDMVDYMNDLKVPIPFKNYGRAAE